MKIIEKKGRREGKDLLWVHTRIFTTRQWCNYRFFFDKHGNKILRETKKTKQTKKEKEKKKWTELD